MVLVALLVFACITTGGWLYAQKYKRPWKFLKELKELLFYIKTKVSFRKLSIVEILEEYVTVHKNQNLLASTLKEDFKTFFKNCKMEQYLLKNGLKIEENKEIISFFKNFGALDCERQIEELDQFIGQVVAMCTQREEQMKSMYPLIIKISIFVGLMCAIVVV